VWREGAEDKRKGETREITTNQQDRRTNLEVFRACLSSILLYSSSGHFPRKEAQVNNNKSHRTSFPFGFFSGVIYPKISCAMCMVSVYASVDLIR
jgi:hypothetical protein